MFHIHFQKVRILRHQRLPVIHHFLKSFFFVITVIYNFPLFTGIDRFPEIFQNVDIYAIDLHDIVSHNTLFDVMVTVEL